MAGTDTLTGETGSADERARALPVDRRGWLIVGAILGLALVLRLIVVAEVARDYTPLTDALHYDTIASSIAEGDGYGDAAIPPMTGPSAFRAPLYPTTLGGVYVVFGSHSYTVGLLANALVGVALVAAIGLLASMLWTRRIGAVALLIAALHPTLSLIGSSLQHEPLLALLTVAAVAAALQHGRSERRWQWAVATGALIGLAGLTRELGLLAAPPIAVLLWQHRPAGVARFTVRALLAPVVAAAVAVVVIAPWTIRNAVQLDDFVPISTSSGFGLAGTFNQTSVDAASGLTPADSWIRPYDDPEALEILVDLDEPTETAVDSALREYALETIGDDPSFVAKVAIGNTLRITDLDAGDYNRNIIARFVPYPRWLMILSVIAGFAVLLFAAYGATRRAARSPAAVWAVPLVSFLFIVFVLPASIRYRGGSIEPFLVLLAAVAVVDLADRFGFSRRLEAWWSTKATPT